MFKYYPLVLIMAFLALTSCKKDEEVAPVTPPVPLPKTTNVLVVNAISDNSSQAKFYLDASLLASVAADSYTSYLAAPDGDRNLIVGSGGVFSSLPIHIEKGKYYTIIVYGTSAKPAVTVVEDSILSPASSGKFAYRYINVYDSSVVKSVSMQSYYPSYGMWATTVGTHDYIKFGNASKFAEYTAGIEAEWRIIEAGSETSSPMAGYKAGSTKVIYTSETKAKGVDGQHFTYVVFGHEKAGSHKLIVHEDQIAK